MSKITLPTLKQRHGRNQRITLAEMTLQPHLLLEQIDDKKLRQIVQTLKRISVVLNDPAFSSLKELKKGLMLAYNDALNLTSNPVSSWASESLPGKFTLLGKLSAFQTGILRTFKMMPDIAEIVKGSIEGIPSSKASAYQKKQKKQAVPPEKRYQEPIVTQVGKRPPVVKTEGQGLNEENKDLHQLHTLLPPDKQGQLKAIMNNALKMPGFLGWLGIKAIPYVNRDTVAEEMLLLTPGHIEKLADIVSKLEDIPAAPLSPEMSGEVEDVAKAKTIKQARKEAEQVIGTTSQPASNTQTPTKQAQDGEAIQISMTSEQFENSVRDAYFFAMKQRTDSLEPKQIKNAEAKISRLSSRLRQRLGKYISLS